VGALSAALYLASRQTVLGLGRLVAWCAALFGGSILLFALSRSIPLSLVIAILVGFFMMLNLAGSNTLLQTIVDDDKRGRVMSLYTMAFMGTAPLGSLLSGAIAHRLGAPAALQISGAACIACALVFALALPGWREQVRPIYRRAGILPELAVALETTAELTSPPEEPA
jgi:MFS family permease